MSKDYPIFDQGMQASAQISQLLANKLHFFLQPLLLKLDTKVDKRLVATFLLLIQTIITFRDRANGLLLSELGGYLLSPRQAPAGTKRISNLLRSPKWTYHLIEHFLWDKADQALAQLISQNETAFLLGTKVSSKRVKASKVKVCVPCVPPKQTASSTLNPASTLHLPYPFLYPTFDGWG